MAQLHHFLFEMKLKWFYIGFISSLKQKTHRAGEFFAI